MKYEKRSDEKSRSAEVLQRNPVAQGADAERDERKQTEDGF